MEEREALKRLKHREEDALAWFIDRYAAYVSTIVSNILGPAAASADLEAIASDVFFAFWTHAKEIRPGKAKAYLGSIARNKAKESTRKTGRELPLEDDMLVISSGTPERELEKRLLQKGMLPSDAADAVAWLKEHRFLDDAATAAQLVDSAVRKGYGRARVKNILYEKGIPKELWDEALEEFGETDGAIDAFLRKKLSGRTLDQKTIKKAVDALIRRGHSYHDIQEGLRRFEADCEPMDTWEDME